MRATFLAALLIVFSLISWWSPDFFSYEMIFINLRGWKKYHSLTHFEDFYIFLCMLVPSYTVFRLIVWGSATVLFCATARRLKLPVGLCLFFLIAAFITKFSYTRVALAYSVLFLGMSFIYRPTSNKIISSIAAIILLIISTFLHKSDIFIVLVLIGILFLPTIKKKSIVPLLIIYPLLSIIMATLLNSIMSSSIADEKAMNQANMYLNEENTSLGLGMIIDVIFNRGAIYVAAFTYLKLIWNHKLQLLNRPTRMIGTAMFYIIAVATIFMFDVGGNTYIFYYRFLNYSVFPIIYFLASLYRQGIYRKQVRLAFILGLIGSIYTMTYSCYISIVNPT